MSRSLKGRRKCYSCRPGCKCDWCMGAVERRAERQAPTPHRDDEDPMDDDDTVRQCLLCGLSAHESVLASDVCPHGLEDP